jgi:hypothetical protein
MRKGEINKKKHRYLVVIAASADLASLSLDNLFTLSAAFVVVIRVAGIVPNKVGLSISNSSIFLFRPSTTFLLLAGNKAHSRLSPAKTTQPSAEPVASLYLGAAQR